MRGVFRSGLFAAAAIVFVCLPSSGELAFARQADQAAALERAFLQPPDDARIMMRWWWFGPSITREEIDAELQRMKQGGIGGVEVAVVYPMSVDDPARGIRNYQYLSPEFLDRFAFASRRARELGLRMDVTLGSGWSFGGPHITPELASARLRSDRREITPDVLQIARPVPYEHEALIAAFVGRGAIREVDANSFEMLDLSGTGPIRLPPGAGPRSLLFYFSGRTGQVVKRAALGAEGYVLDHYSRAAIETHLREVGDKLVAAAGPGGIHAIFCDSLEVYEAGWTPDMLAEFRARRGYDLRPQLPMIEYGNDARAQQVRRDVGRTLTELYEERFLAPIQDWSRKNKVLFRIQGYGQPPASLSSFRYADLFDGEGFEWRMLSRARWAASAAHVLGRSVAASETWTWVHSPAFRATPLDLKGEADLHFLSGINQLIGHGWPHSASKAPAPGWPFYAAGAFTDKNPWWPVMPDLAAYLQRVSFLLRQGEPVADVAIYAPTEDARAAMRPGAADYLNLWAGVRDRLGPALVPAVLDAGYSFDLIDDGTLQEAAARNYKVVVLPSVRWLPDATKTWLDEYARAGGTVIALGRVPDGEWSLPRATPADDLARRLAAAFSPDVQMTPSAPEIGFVHRRLPGADVYFVANTHNAPRDLTIRFRARTAHAELWNAIRRQRRASDGNRRRSHTAAPRRLRVAHRRVSRGRRIGASEADAGAGVVRGPSHRVADEHRNIEPKGRRAPALVDQRSGDRAPFRHRDVSARARHPGGIACRGNARDSGLRGRQFRGACVAPGRHHAGQLVCGADLGTDPRSGSGVRQPATSRGGMGAAVPCRHYGACARRRERAGD